MYVTAWTCFFNNHQTPFPLYSGSIVAHGLCVFVRVCVFGMQYQAGSKQLSSDLLGDLPSPRQPQWPTWLHYREVKHVASAHACSHMVTYTDRCLAVDVHKYLQLCVIVCMMHIYTH